MAYAVFTPTTIAQLKANYAGVPAAQTFLNTVSAYAQSTLSYIPCSKPVMDIEGNLASTDAAAINTYFDIAIACGIRYSFTDESFFAENAVKYLLAFSITYIPIGNPITEEVFYKFVAVYDLVKDTMTAPQKAQIDTFLTTLFTTAQAFIAARPAVLSHSNFESSNLLLMTAIAYTLDDSAKKTVSQALYESQIGLNILAAGTIETSIPYAVGSVPAEMLDDPVELGATFDKYHRDSIGYHCASVAGLIEAAAVAKNNGGSWQTYTTGGKILNDAVAFALLYANGTRTHTEFVNSLVQPFDAGRVATFNSVVAKNLVSLAAMVLPAYAGNFDTSTMPLFQRILYYSMT